MFSRKKQTYAYLLLLLLVPASENLCVLIESGYMESTLPTIGLDLECGAPSDAQVHRRFLWIYDLTSFILATGSRHYYAVVLVHMHT